MLYVTGDTHGDWMSRLNTDAFPEQKTMTKDDYEASYRELIAKTVAESKSMRCRQAWARWLEVRAQENRPFNNHGKPFTHKEILDMTPPNDIPLPPFCYAKQVSIDAVLDEMNVPK